MARLSLLTGVLCLFSTPLVAATFAVDDLGDAPDSTPGDGICATAEQRCTFRAAIGEANALAGADAITFSVAGTIAPSSDLPTILQRTTIDGTTAPGWAGTPLIVLDGADLLSIGVNFGATASASELSGLKIIGFAASGVNITASGMLVHHNYIGPIGGGTANFDGIVVSGTDNQIGTGESAGNVVSGNMNDGIVVSGSGHRLLANRIGTTPDGMTAMGNGRDGIKVFDSANDIFIGGETSLVDHHNIVAGNGDDGIDIDHASNVTVGGNDVGIDHAANATIANAGTAIELTNANDNILSVPDDSLTVSGDDATGIRIVSGTGNVIGLGLTGDAATVGNEEVPLARVRPAAARPVHRRAAVESTLREPRRRAAEDTAGQRPALPRVAAIVRPTIPTFTPPPVVAAPATPAVSVTRQEPPVSPRSKLGLVFIAIGAALASILRFVLSVR